MQAPYENPILAWWSGVKYRGGLVSALSESPPLLDVPVSDFEVLHAWVVADEILTNSFQKKKLIMSLETGKPPWGTNKRDKIITWLVFSGLGILLFWYFARPDSDTPPFLSSPVWLVLFLVVGEDFLRAYFRLRWDGKVSHYQGLAAFLALSFLAFALQDSISPPSHGLKVTWWFLAPVGLKIVITACILAAWIALMLLTYELLIRLALSAVHKKRMGNLH